MPMRGQEKKSRREKVREQERTGGTLSLSVFSPNTGKGKRTLDTFKGKDVLAGLREEDGSDLELTALKASQHSSFSTCKSVPVVLSGILLGSRCPEGRGKKRVK